MAGSAARLIKEALGHLGVPFEVRTHAPAQTLADSAPVAEAMGAIMCKNYFLKPRRRAQYVLYTARADGRMNTALLSRAAGTPRLTFADEAALAALLRAAPGAVSPLGLWFDTDCAVRFFMDEALCHVPKLAFHPCDNTETIALSRDDFLNIFLPATGHAPTKVRMDLPGAD